MQLENIPFSIQDLIANCQSIIYPKAIEKNLDVYFYAETAIKKKLYGDPLRIRQVLLNLLSNAVKFTERGCISLTAIVTDECDDHINLCFDVKDNGIGMTQEQIAIVFEPFAQADVSTTRKYGGTGLGLSITKNLLDLMESKLEIDSTPGVGSTFSFSIKLGVAGDIEDEPEYISSAAEMKKPLFKGEILVFEDNKMNQQVIAEHLTQVGLTTEIAENGLIGIEKVNQRIEKGLKPYDLIFMDIQMPVMDGIEATPKVIALGTGTPIVTMTANIFNTDMELYHKLGMTDYLGKPFTSRELWRCLLRHLKPLGFESADDSNESLMFKLKKEFVKNNQNIYDDISKAVVSGDITLAYRLAHTVKSNAGQIGKTQLQNAAAEIETAFRNGRKAELDNFKAALDKVLKSLSPLLDETVEKEPPEIQNSQYNAEDMRILFNKLEPLLRNSRLECLDLVQELRCIPGSNELIEQMEDLYFGAAVKTLDKFKSEKGLE